MLVVIGRVPVDYISAPGNLGRKLLLANNVQIGSVGADGKLVIPAERINDLFIYPVQQKNTLSGALSGVCVVRYEAQTDIAQLPLPRVETVLQPNSNVAAANLAEATEKVDLLDALSGTRFYLVEMNDRIVQAIFLGAEPQQTELSVFDPLPAVEGTQLIGYNINNERKTNTNTFKFDDVDYVINGTPIADVYGAAIGAPILVPVALHAISTKRDDIPRIVERRSVEDTVIKGPADATWTFPDGHKSTGDLVITGSINGPILLTARGGRTVALEVFTTDEKVYRCRRCEQRYIESENVHGSCQWHTEHAQEINRAIETNLVTVDAVPIPLSENKPYAYYLNRISDDFSNEVNDKINWLDAQDQTPISLSRSPKAMILSDLRKLVASYQDFTNLDDQKTREYARVVVHLLDKRPLKDCLRLPYYDPNDPDQRMTNGFRNPNKRYGLGEVWECCGFSAEQPGCWVGKHSQDPYPDLQSIAEDQRGSEYLNDPNTSEAKYKAIVIAASNDDWIEVIELENAFNAVHGGVLQMTSKIAKSLGIPDEMANLLPLKQTSKSLWVRDISQSFKYDGTVTDLFAEPITAPTLPETQRPKVVKPKKKEFTRLPPPAPYRAPEKPSRQKTKKSPGKRIPEPSSLSLEQIKGLRYIVKEPYYFYLISGRVTTENLELARRNLNLVQAFKAPKPNKIFVNYKSNVEQFISYAKSIKITFGYQLSLPYTRTPLMNFLFAILGNWELQHYSTLPLIYLQEIIDLAAETEDIADELSKVPEWTPQIDFDGIDLKEVWTGMNKNVEFVGDLTIDEFYDANSPLIDLAVQAIKKFRPVTSYDEDLIVWKAFLLPDKANMEALERLIDRYYDSEGGSYVFKDVILTKDEGTPEIPPVEMIKYPYRFLIDRTFEPTPANMKKFEALREKLRNLKITADPTYENYSANVENFVDYAESLELQPDAKFEVDDDYDPKGNPLAIAIESFFGDRTSLSQRISSLLSTPVNVRLTDTLDTLPDWRSQMQVGGLPVASWWSNFLEEDEFENALEKIQEAISNLSNEPESYDQHLLLWKAILYPSVENLAALNVIEYVETTKRSTKEERIARLQQLITKKLDYYAVRFDLSESDITDSNFEVCNKNYIALLELLKVPYDRNATYDNYANAVLDFMQYVELQIGDKTNETPYTLRKSQSTPARSGDLTAVEQWIRVMWNRQNTPTEKLEDLRGSLLRKTIKYSLNSAIPPKIPTFKTSVLVLFNNLSRINYWNSLEYQGAKPGTEVRTLNTLKKKLIEARNTLDGFYKTLDDTKLPYIFNYYNALWKATFKPSRNNITKLDNNAKKLTLEDFGYVPISTKLQRVEVLKNLIQYPLYSGALVFIIKDSIVNEETLKRCEKNFKFLESRAWETESIVEYKARLKTIIAYAQENLKQDLPVEQLFKKGTEENLGNKLITAIKQQRETAAIRREIYATPVELDLSKKLIEESFFNLLEDWQVKYFLRPETFTFWDQNNLDRYERYEKILQNYTKLSPSFFTAYVNLCKTALVGTEENFKELENSIKELTNLPLDVSPESQLELFKNQLSSPLKVGWWEIKFITNNIGIENLNICQQNYRKLRNTQPRNKNYEKYRTAVEDIVQYIVENFEQNSGKENVFLAEKVKKGGLTEIEAFISNWLTTENQDPRKTTAELVTSVKTLDLTKDVDQKFYNKFQTAVEFANLEAYSFWRLFGIEDVQETANMLQEKAMKLTALLKNYPQDSFSVLLVLWKACCIPNIDNIKALNSEIGKYQNLEKQGKKIVEDSSAELDAYMKQLYELLKRKELPELVRKRWPIKYKDGDVFDLERARKAVEELQAEQQLNREYFKDKGELYTKFLTVLDAWTTKINQFYVKLGSQSFSYQKKRKDPYLKPPLSEFDDMLISAKVSNYEQLRNIFKQANEEFVASMVKREFVVDTGYITADLLGLVKQASAESKVDLPESAFLRHTVILLKSAQDITPDQRVKIKKAEDLAQIAYIELVDQLNMLSTWLPVKIPKFATLPVDSNFEKAMQFWERELGEYQNKAKEVNYRVIQTTTVITNIRTTIDKLDANQFDAGMLKSNWKHERTPNSTLQGYILQLEYLQRELARKEQMMQLLPQAKELNRAYTVSKRQWEDSLRSVDIDQVPDKLDEVSGILRDYVESQTVNYALEYLTKESAEAIRKANVRIETYELDKQDLADIEKYLVSNIKLFSPEAVVRSPQAIAADSAIQKYSADGLVIGTFQDVLKESVDLVVESAADIEEILGYCEDLLHQLEARTTLVYFGVTFVDDNEKDVKDLREQYKNFDYDTGLQGAEELYSRIEAQRNSQERGRNATLHDLNFGTGPFAYFGLELLFIEIISNIAFYPKLAKRRYLQALESQSSWNDDDSSLKLKVKEILETTADEDFDQTSELLAIVFHEMPYKFAYSGSPNLNYVGARKWWPFLADMIKEDPNSEHEKLLAVYENNLLKAAKSIQASYDEIIAFCRKTKLANSVYRAFFDSNSKTADEAFEQYLKRQFTFKPPRAYRDYATTASIDFLNDRIGQIQLEQHRTQNIVRQLLGMPRQARPQAILVDSNRKALLLVQKMQLEMLFDRGLIQDGDTFVDRGLLPRNALRFLASSLSGRAIASDVGPNPTAPIVGIGAWFALLQVAKPSDFLDAWHNFVISLDPKFAQLEFTLDVETRKAVVGLYNYDNDEEPVLKVTIDEQKIKAEEKRGELASSESLEALRNLYQELQTSPKFAFILDESKLTFGPQLNILNQVLSTRPRSITLAFEVDGGGLFFNRKRNAVPYEAREDKPNYSFWKPLQINKIIKTFYWVTGPYKAIRNQLQNYPTADLSASIQFNQRLVDEGEIDKRQFLPNPQNADQLEAELNEDFYKLFGEAEEFKRNLTENFNIAPEEEEELESEESEEAEENPTPAFQEVLAQRTGWTMDTFNDRIRTAYKLRTNIYWNWQQARKDAKRLSKPLDSINYQNPRTPRSIFQSQTYYRNLLWLLIFAEEDLKRSQDETDQEVVEEIGRLYQNKDFSFVDWTEDLGELDIKFEKQNDVEVIYLPFPLRDIELLRMYYVLHQKYDSKRLHVRSTFMADRVNIGTLTVRMWNSRLADVSAIEKAKRFWIRNGFDKKDKIDDIQESLWIRDKRITLETVRKFNNLYLENLQVSQITEDVANLVLYINGFDKSLTHVSEIIEFFKNTNFDNFFKNNGDKTVWNKVKGANLDKLRPGTPEYTAKLLSQVDENLITQAYRDYYHARNINRFLTDAITQPENEKTTIYAVLDSTQPSAEFQNIGHGIAVMEQFKETLSEINGFEKSDPKNVFEIVELVSRQGANVGKVMYAAMVLDFIAESYERGRNDPFVGYKGMAWMDLDTSLELTEKKDVFVEIYAAPKPGLVTVYSKWGLQPLFTAEPNIVLMGTFENYLKQDVADTATWLAAYLSGALYDKLSAKPKGRFIRPTPSKLFGEENGKGKGKCTPDYQISIIKLAEKTGILPQITYDETAVLYENRKEYFDQIKDASPLISPKIIKGVSGASSAKPIIDLAELDREKNELTCVRNPAMFVEFKLIQGTVRFKRGTHVDWLNALIPRKGEKQATPKRSPARPRPIPVSSPELEAIGRLAAQRLQGFK